MMGHKDQLKTGMEVDVICARDIYCYLVNRPQNKGFAKNQINRRNRYKIKQELKDRGI